METTTIRISNDLKRNLDAFKIIPRETYEELIFRLLEPHMELNEETLRECEETRNEKEISFKEVLKCMK